MFDTKPIVSAMASIVLMRTITNELIPHEVLNIFQSALHHLSRHFSAQFTVVIEEFQGMARNLVFEAAQIYLGTKATVSAERVKVNKSDDHKNLSFNIDKNEEVSDKFEGISVKWKLICIEVDSSRIRHYDNDSSHVSEIRSYELTFHKKHKNKIFDSYLPYVMEIAKKIKQGGVAIKIHSNEYNSWSYDPPKFNHPMSFNTLAIDGELQREIVEDLDKFVRAKEFYRRTGKAWKRGYLLYGPPGTGKSSLIAAMANYLNYDIYDLDLTAVGDNRSLRDLILGMSNRSILVIEDIDCTINLQNREEDEEAVNNEHNKIEVLLGQVQVTPAEIAEELTKDADATECLQDLIKFLEAKKMITVETIKSMKKISKKNIKIKNISKQKEIKNEESIKEHDEGCENI
ncbi:hypothetical protein TSUD_53500 [Trifolium subterraneum]|uniref:AAA+ ATPase domain-containing protein n=1 Tax=Trifolium subterraneum TaxID=3900 RepID=A0A2Z6N5K6_TRISU|nr:hypothetical protein TSUD_53500 [Trifolium subterraneum]